jgi:hypothetical protein
MCSWRQGLAQELEIPGAWVRGPWAAQSRYHLSGKRMRSALSDKCPEG